MKILQVHNYYKQSGGEDEVFAAETEILRQNGNEVLTQTTCNSSIDEMSRPRLALHTIWSESSRNNFFQLLKNNRPDIVHFHNIFPLISPSVYYVCKQLKIPTVQTLHNYRLICPAAILFRDSAICEDCFNSCCFCPGIRHGCYHDSHLQTAVISSMLISHRLFGTWKNKVNFYIALTEFSRKKFIQGGLPKDKVVVKPNFIYPEIESGKSKNRYILFVGRLSPEKGIMTLLGAWKLLKNVPLKIVGGGPLEKTALENLEAEGLKDIEFLGRKSHQETVELIKKAYCLIFPSNWYECFPMVIIESFASSTPVIASRLGAMEDIIDEGRNGIFFEPQNPKDLAQKVNYVWNNSDKIAIMGQEARKDYQDKYSANRNYKLLMDIYYRAIDQANA
ncbi:MAG: glycosyltransferase family 4 protein [Candidatus Omnitrophica bacterium]|nr:glycosyltransferase family 4 protein [Candidatus Omnitrophota bacterium]